MNQLIAKVLIEKSKEIPWVAGGGGDAVFDRSFIPDQGPNGGVWVIDRISAHCELTFTVATATFQGEDMYRAFRKTSITDLAGDRIFADVLGDSMRILSYVEAGALATHEHPDVAASTVTAEFTQVIQLAQPFAYDPDDTSLPAYLLDNVAIGMAQNADMATGTSVITITSGKYWLVVEGHEEMSVIHHCNQTHLQQDFETSTLGTLPVNGRLKDLILFKRGQNGGASIANITDVQLVGQNKTPLLVNPDLKQRYARARGQALNLFSTKGNPVRTDALMAADAGTLRGVAPLVTTGDKHWEGDEVKNQQVRVTLASALTPITMLARIARRRSERLRQIIIDTHRVSQSYLKTRDKTKRNASAWREDQRPYLQEKFHNGPGQPVVLFSGRRFG